MSIRFAAALILFTSGLLPQAAGAQPPESPRQAPLPDAAAIARQAQAIADQAKQIVGDDSIASPPVLTEANRAAAQAVLDTARQYVLDMSSDLSADMLDQAGDEPTQVWLFVNADQVAAFAPVVSRELAALAAQGRDFVAVIAVRGLPEGTRRISDLIKLINAPMQDLDRSRLSVRLDSRAFRDAGVKVTPTLVWGSPQSRELSASGATSLDWFIGQHSAGRRGNIGSFGPTEPLKDIDLIDLIRQRAAAIDWNEQREGAIRRFWDKRPVLNLPRATETKIRYLDLSFQVTQDVTLPDGRYIARKGDVVNPGAVVPFTKKVVVFDPRDAEQSSWVQRLITSRQIDPGQMILLVPTPGDTPSFEGHAQLEDQIGHPIHLLDHQMASRLQLRFLPTTAFLDEGLMVVKEHALTDSLQNAFETGLFRQSTAQQ
jgi:conjugal transfer pilus assembly protein TraW